MPLPPAVAAHLAAGELAAAREAVRAAFARGVPTGDRRAWALAAEATGSSLLALQAWQAVLAAEPEAADALRRLAELHADRGDAGRAKACRARLRALLGEAEEEPPRPDPAADEPPPAPLGEPGAGDLVRFVHLFAGREGVHARQWADRDKVGYSPVHSALTPELAAAHLRGDVTLGSYLVRRDDRALQLALDLDATKAAVRRATGDAGRARDLRRRIHQAGLALLEGLRAAGFDPLLVDSGYKGRHLWCVLPEPALAGRVRALGEGWARALAPADPELAVEVFPRQDRVPPGRLGNLIKLPLGIHLKTGRRCVLLDDAGQPLPDPWERLRTLRRVELGDLHRPPPSLVRPGSSRTATAEASPEAGTAGDAEPPARDPRSQALPQAAAPAPFAEADFDARPRLAAVLGGCAVLRALVDTALRENRVDRQETIALRNTLGHLPEGVEAVNYLLARSGAPKDSFLGKRLAGNPISCKGVRRRLGRLVAGAACRCAFEVPDSYPHPLLHAQGVSLQAPPAAAPPVEDLIDALLRTEARLAALEGERDELRGRVLARVAALPGGRLVLGDATWRADAVEGIPVLQRELAVGE